MIEENLICKFHKTITWNNGPDTDFCRYVKDSIDCDGTTKSDLISCPLWGELLFE